ncbi:MAG: hypothetical protein R3305_03475 [Gammaproteobacteria bacterium]|nr:hypothetical protein [Gammaproteobacteria bacterium]
MRTRSRLSLALVAALLSSTALSGEAPRARMPAQSEVGIKETALTAAQIEAETKAYREALEKRIADELAKSLATIEAPRIQLVMAEVPTRG